MIKLVSFSDEIDDRFKSINSVFLLTMLLWPAVFFGSMYTHNYDELFTDWKVLLSFVLINSYPVYFFILHEINARIYKKTKWVGYILPVSIISIIVGGTLFIFIYALISYKSLPAQTPTNTTGIHTKKLPRKKAITNITNTTIYKIRNNNVYYKNFKIVGADTKSFEYLGHNSYAKDKFKYYYKGVPIEGVDYSSFKIISKEYAKDKYNVYHHGKQ